ncbi:MAG: GspH/FimT family pseudopilin [Desulfobulbaceae bacterium]|nr:GspH/FimT family pseudopilin [Desulfobulbaceae bacterium]
MNQSASARKAGFTLVEVMVTLAVFAIVAAVAVPAISGWRDAFSLKSASQDVYAMLMLAKTEAMKRNRTHTATFISPSDMLVCAGAAACNTAPPETMVRQETLPSDVRFVAPSGGACAAPLPSGAISFRANSIPVGGQCGSISLAVGARQMRIEINRAGNITVF